MAYVILNDERKTQIDREKALGMWRVLNEQEDGTEEQVEFVNNIKTIYLNWRYAPDDYLLRYRKLIEPIVKSEWSCNRYGTPTRPQVDDFINERVSRLYGFVW